MRRSVGIPAVACATSCFYDLRMSAARSVVEPDSAELEALLRRCAQRDASALEALYRKVAPILLGTLLSMLKRRDEAEDALQDVFVKIWNQANQFDAIRGRPMAWLIALARYRAIDLLRGRRTSLVLVDTEALDGVAAMRDSAAGNEGEATQADLGGALQRCLDQIAAAQRRCVLLAYERGLSHAEIAQTVNEPLGTVKSWVRRSLQSLRRCLEA